MQKCSARHKRVGIAEAGRGPRLDKHAPDLPASRQRGFTIIELLVAIAILGILAAVIVPNVSGFLGTGSLAAASSELENVKTATLAYYGEHNAWPGDTTVLGPYINGALKATYSFDNATGFVTGASGVTWTAVTWSNPPGPPYTQDGKWIR